MAAYGKTYTTAGSAMGRKKPGHDAFDEEVFGLVTGGRGVGAAGPTAAGLSRTPLGSQSQANQPQGYQMPEPVGGFGSGSGGGGSGSGTGNDSGPPQTDDFTGDWQSDWQAYLASLGTQLTPRDTTSEEALIQQNFEGLLGQGTNALAAQMGAAGFGQSGALMQAGSDLQGQLARQAAGQVNDVRRSAQQDYLNQLGLIGQMLMGGEQTGMSSEWYGNLMEMIQAELNQGSSDPSGSPDPLDALPPDARRAPDLVAAATPENVLDALNRQGQPGPTIDAGPPSAAEQGLDAYGFTAWGGKDLKQIPGWPNGVESLGDGLYRGSDGKIYDVKTKA